MSKLSVCIDVPEMDKAIQFYVNALGCKCVKKGSDYSELATDDLAIYLSQKNSVSNPKVNEISERAHKQQPPVNLDFVVSDIDRCVSAVQDHGGIKEGDNSGDWGAIAFCSDPFGNGFCVLQYAN